MSAINKFQPTPKFCHLYTEMTLCALRDGIQVPEAFIALGEEISPHMLPRTTPATETSRTPTARKPAAQADSFDDAVLQAVTSSTNGVDRADLPAILAHHGRQKVAKIDGALGRLKAAGKIEQRPDKTWAIAGTEATKPPAARKASTTARTPRAPRTRAATPPPPTTGTEQAAGAGASA